MKCDIFCGANNASQAIKILCRIRLTQLRFSSSFIKWIYRESVFRIYALIHLQMDKHKDTDHQQHKESDRCSFLYGERHLFAMKVQRLVEFMFHVPLSQWIQLKLRHPREVEEKAKLQTISFFISVACSAYVLMWAVQMPMLAFILCVIVFSRKHFAKQHFPSEYKRDMQSGKWMLEAIAATTAAWGL